MSINNKYLLFGLLIIGLLFFFMIKEGITNDISDIDLYKKLYNEFNIIFPNRNRNGGGPQYYNYIVNMNPTINDYKRYNKFYCAVSGSLIDPERGEENIYDNIVVKGIDNNYYYGKFYRCCRPCICDIMRDNLVLVEEYNLSLKDGELNHYVLTINDPCHENCNIPEEVTSFNCKNNKTNNGIHTESGRLIIGILHDVEEYNENIHNMKEVNEYCYERNNTPIDELKYGMGNISLELYLCN